MTDSKEHKISSQTNEKQANTRKENPLTRKFRQLMNTHEKILMSDSPDNAC